MASMTGANPAFVESSREAPAAQAPPPWTQTGHKVRVLVASEIRLFRDAVAALLGHQNGLSVVGMTGLPQALVQTARLHPDIVLFDAARPSNLAYARPLADQVPDCKVVAFGIPEGDADIVALATAGVAGYVRDDATPEDVVAVLASAMRDELLCSPRAAASLCHQVARLSRNDRGREPGGPPTSALSDREMQIADLINRGLSNKLIARQLGIQATTVKNHVHNIFDKLKVHRRGEAAARLRAVLRTRPPAPQGPAGRAGLVD